MNRSSYVALAATAIIISLFALAQPAVSGNRSDDPLGVAISPHTLILGEIQGSVSVHTDLPYGLVDKGCPVTLGGVEAIYLKADSRGCLVAKFAEAEIKEIVAPPSATLALRGMRTDGTAFVGSDTVKVIIDPNPGN